MLFDSRSELLLIAGPCSLEGWDTVAPVAQELVRLGELHEGLRFVFKGSFDKANRTSLGSDRGTGLEEGLALFERVKAEFGLPCLTDVHLPQQCARVAEVVDVLQIPAFLCRQTDLLVAAAESGAVINVKKGQFLSPMEMEFVVAKLEGAGAREFWQTDRGTTFGYQNLVVDMRSFSMMGAFGHPTVIDATHAVQLPGAAGGKSGGQREYVDVLARAALAAGADGVFAEVHPMPERAISDAASQIPLGEFEAMVEGWLRVWRAVR